MDHIIFQLLQLSLYALAVWSVVKGEWPERCGAITLFADLAIRTALSALGYPLDFYKPMTVYLLTTGLLFIASLTLAVKSNRVWPLFFSAFCLVQFAGHFCVAVLQTGNSRAYWVMTQIPFILQALILGFGTLAGQARARKGVSAYDWC
jgi:hypothetical protein